MLGWFRKLSRQSGTENRSTAQPPANEVPAWDARMWYRFVTYHELNSILSLEVDVMMEGADIVFVPTAELWHRSAPPFARDRRNEVLARLKGIKWNRELVWEETNGAN